ncbi:MAG: hypothetical protein A2511_14285 [Deltaproteobacteria bacterium RIFOXYD12_FULL_50_9]|nr:MAG: hypothetical protein A2511_14285 [Deltaproteobacteria bacterium RIFOXYD12_FULL_50_9]
MKKRIRYAVFGLFAYLVCLMFTLPADFSYALLKKKVRLPFPVEFYGVEGSWRVGRAAQILVNGRRFTDFEWQLNILPFFSGQMGGAVVFHQERGVFTGNILTGQDTITITQAQAQLPAEMLQTYLPDIGIRLKGEVKAVFDVMQISKGALVAANGALVFRGAEILSPESLALGDIKAQFITENNGVKVVMSDGGGPLLVEGQIMLKPDRFYSFTGAFAVRDRKQTFLADTLRLFGKPGSDGRVVMSYNGRLPMLSP